MVWIEGKAVVLGYGVQISIQGLVTNFFLGALLRPQQRGF